MMTIVMNIQITLLPLKLYTVTLILGQNSEAIKTEQQQMHSVIRFNSIITNLAGRLYDLVKWSVNEQPCCASGASISSLTKTLSGKIIGGLFESLLRCAMRFACHSPWKKQCLAAHKWKTTGLMLVISTRHHRIIDFL